MGKIEKIFEKILYIYCYIIIFFACGHPYLTVNDSYVAPLLGFGIVLLIIYKIIYNQKTKQVNNLIYLLLFGIVLSIVYNDLYNITVYLRLILSVVYAILVIKMLDFKKIVRHFILIMSCICIISLFGYFLINMLNLIELPTFTNVNNVTYGNGYIYFYIPSNRNRNCGLFWEPGLFATFVLFDLLLNHIFYNNKFKFNILISLITMLTINSSAGYLLSIFYLCLFVYSKIREKKDLANLTLKFLFLPLMIIVLLFFNYSISFGKLSNNPFFAKLQYDNFMSSFRVKSIIFNIKLFAKNCVFGCGIVKYYNIAPSLLCPDTSTSTLLLALFGISGIIYTIIILINVLKIKKITFIEKILILFILISIVNKEPHFNIAFTWMIILGVNVGGKGNNEII